MCVFVCLFVRLRISLLRIKLAASHFAVWFIGVQGRESQIFVNFAPPEAQNRTKRPARGPRPPGCRLNTTVEMRRRKRHARDAQFVKFKHVCNISRGEWLFSVAVARTWNGVRHHVTSASSASLLLCTCDMTVHGPSSFYRPYLTVKWSRSNYDTSFVRSLQYIHLSVSWLSARCSNLSASACDRQTAGETGGQQSIAIPR